MKAVVPGLIGLKLLKTPYPYANTVDTSFLKAAGKEHLDACLVS